MYCRIYPKAFAGRSGSSYRPGHMEQHKKIINGLVLAKNSKYSMDDDTALNPKTMEQINGIFDNCYRALNDDFNTAQAIAHIFNLLKKINSISTGNLKCGEIGEETFTKLMSTYILLVEEVLGLKEEKPTDVEGIINIILDLYKQAKAAKDYNKVDEIRAKLKLYGVVLKDMKESVGWAYEEL